MSQPAIDWTKLEKQYSVSLIQVIRRLFSEEGPFQISAQILSAETACEVEEAERLLLELSPPLDQTSVLRCPVCHFVLTDGESRSEFCPECREQFVEHGGVSISTLFAYAIPRTRDVTWVLALHGMNTRGAWQEEFNWRVSTAYGRSIPVAIYKYGLVRPAAIWRPSLRRLTKHLVEKVERLRGDTVEHGFVGAPDVIAHSLGTWLIGHALLWNSSLVVGRVILTGSILRPDFNWDALIASGRVEAVLNHYGGRDFWARIAHYVIPDSGPSGRCGFNTSMTIDQICTLEFGHSDFFLDRNLPIVFDSVWRPFLTRPVAALRPGVAEASDGWRPSPWLFRATLLPIFLLVIYWAIIASAVACCGIGAYELVRWLR